MNAVFQYLQLWLGVLHQLSLVDRHESNGVERSNGKILTFLRNLICDEHIANEWSDAHNIASVAFVMNSMVNSETGFPTFVLHFGESDAT